MAASVSYRYSIRLAGLSDIDDIVRLTKSLAIFSGRPVDTLQTAAELGENLSSWYQCLVLEYKASAEASPEIVGYTLWTYNYYSAVGRYASMSEIFIDPSHRGRGGGLGLMQGIAEISRKKGCNELRWLMLDSNEEAKTFYNKMNAEHQYDTIGLVPMHLTILDLIHLAERKLRIEHNL